MNPEIIQLLLNKDMVRIQNGVNELVTQLIEGAKKLAQENEKLKAELAELKKK